MARRTSDPRRPTRGAAPVRPPGGRAWPAFERGPRGATLLELLLVVALLAIVAAGALRMAGVRGEGLGERLAEVELVRLRSALLEFRAHTGHLPRSGPFALAIDDPLGVVPVPPQGADWFRSAANVVQLLEQPHDVHGAELLPFDADTGRGWRGPYLVHGTEGFVTIGSRLGPDGAGSPVDGEQLERVPAVADPFDGPGPIGGLLSWTSSGGSPAARRGRPLLLLDLDDPQRARLLSFGPNGIYEHGAGDDLVLWVLR